MVTAIVGLTYECPNCYATHLDKNDVFTCPDCSGAWVTPDDFTEGDVVCRVCVGSHKETYHADKA